MACGQFYTIQEGDTLFKIANQFDTTVENILRFNPDLNPANLPVGRTICVISATNQPVTCPLGTLPYNVNAGDTILSIALRFGTSVEALLRANPDIEPYNLQVGQRICIAQNFSEPPLCPTRNFYVVRNGDTLRNIARTFGVGQNDIMRLNPDMNPRRLSPGEIICIPLAPSPFEIIINIMAKRLTVYRGGSIFREYIIATGKPETPTPVGNFEIVNKEIDPGGPYGTRWLGLSAKGYGIHGTNNPSSIGTAASNGCIRMYNEDIESLFDITVVGTPVRILP
ncbi:MAG: LysM peptidoglycan-binding domain-containing protein [Ruminococcaceae bacterium]|nr:LysM peptidoglycan-binding domain-containing protein [Oscillospiraceae bacterium]